MQRVNRMNSWTVRQRNSFEWNCDLSVDIVVKLPVFLGIYN